MLWSAQFFLLGSQKGPISSSLQVREVWWYQNVWCELLSQNSISGFLFAPFFSISNVTALMGVVLIRILLYSWLGSKRKTKAWNILIPCCQMGVAFPKHICKKSEIYSTRYWPGVYFPKTKVFLPLIFLEKILVVFIFSLDASPSA